MCAGGSLGGEFRYFSSGCLSPFFVYFFRCTCHSSRQAYDSRLVFTSSLSATSKHSALLDEFCALFAGIVYPNTARPFLFGWLCALLFVRVHPSWQDCRIYGRHWLSTSLTNTGTRGVGNGRQPAAAKPASICVCLSRDLLVYGLWVFMYSLPSADRRSAAQLAS